MRGFLIFILVLEGFLWGASSKEFSILVKKKTRNVFLSDLDGDGKKEVILLNKDKEVTAFRLSEGRITRAFDKVFQGNIIDFGEVYPKNPGKEIVIISNNEARIFKYDGNGIKLLKSISLMGSLIYPEKSRVLRYCRVIYDINGKDYILFFYPDSVALIDTSGIRYKRKIFSEEEVSTLQDRASPAEQTGVYYIKTSYSMPLIFFEDVLGDTKKELVQFIRDSLFIDGKLALDLSFIESGSMELFPPRLILKDINNDGKADILVSKGEIGLPFGKRSSVYLFLNKQGFKTLPDQVIISESFSPNVVLKDINNDGKLDLIVTTSGFNLFSLIKLILTRKMDIQYSVYLFKVNSFTKTPVFTRSFSLKMGDDSSSTMVDFSTDFDGDGYGDIMFFKKGEIEVFKGNGDGYEKKYCCKFSIKTSSRYLVDDLDGNGKVDILFWNLTEKGTEIWGLLR